jgi:hypothetical protein
MQIIGKSGFFAAATTAHPCVAASHRDLHPHRGVTALAPGLTGGGR